MTEIKNITKYKQEIEGLKKQITTEFDNIINKIKNYETGLEENEGMFEQMKDESAKTKKQKQRREALKKRLADFEDKKPVKANKKPKKEKPLSQKIKEFFARI